ncbi:hypothetical protein HJG60_011747 [Phyllostomus discolor]|uniref:Uncharacterized protein n=1 Tax=Phyllostomus discolor TaxID=89673 RepID=A0A834DXM5_9CHIR|nr:hypothetical protein HJG60_011747 [Phyllostomus discolor]
MREKGRERKHPCVREASMGCFQYTPKLGRKTSTQKVLQAMPMALHFLGKEGQRKWSIHQCLLKAQPKPLLRKSAYSKAKTSYIKTKNLGQPERTEFGHNGKGLAQSIAIAVYGIHGCTLASHLEAAVKLQTMFPESQFTG